MHMPSSGICKSHDKRMRLKSNYLIYLQSLYNNWNQQQTTTISPNNFIYEPSSSTEAEISTSIIERSRTMESPCCGVRRLTSMNLLFGGTDVEPGEWPWHVAIYYLDASYINGTYRCGGNIISHNYVLTGNFFFFL